MKLLKYILITFFVLIWLTSMSSATSLTVDQILNNAYDSTSGTLQMSISQGTWLTTTALTNTAAWPGILTHETSGTPANGIGVGLKFIQEGGDGDQTIMLIDAIMDDVTAASEDASFSVKLMTAGSAAAEKFAIESTGVLTLVNGEGIDNYTTDGVIAFTTAGIDVQGGDIILQNDEVIDNGTNGEVEIQVETALTNAVGDILNIQHTTSGTPANGLGTAIVYEIETSAANNEEVLGLEAVIDDSTLGSEDASFSVKLMSAGAARAEKFAIESTGVITLINGETIDNATADGSIAVNGSFDINAAGGLILSNDETITNAVNGTINLLAATSATNTVDDVLQLQHSTSGTAANGIGVGMLFLQETANGNDEVIASIDAVAVDVTDTSEDGEIIFSTMTGGASATEKLRIHDTGEVEFQKGILPDAVTADPCGSGFPEGSIFYNTTANVLCFCDGTNDLKIADGAACF